jgi:hypothetical protein
MTLRALSALLTLVLAASNGACGEPPQRGEPPPSVAPITTTLAAVRGWGPLTLGMSIDAVRAALARRDLSVTDERSAPASESLTLTFEVDGDVGSAWFTRGALEGVALRRTYARDADARSRVAALESAWGPGERWVLEGRNAGHLATHREWRTDAVVVTVVVRVPGTGLATEYSEDYRAP